MKHALQLAAHLEGQGLSTPEGLEWIAEARWSRRRFLQTVAGATAGAALGTLFPRCTASDLTLSPTHPRIVIVGAGCAGLTCAYRLQQAGLQARVLEAGTRVGGRMFSLRRVFPEGQLAELGGEFIDTNHTSLLGLAQELSLTLVDLVAADDDLETDFFSFDQRRVPFEEMVEAFRPVAERILADLATLDDDAMITYKHPNNAEALDQLSLAEWLDTRGATGVMRAVLDVAYVGEYGLDTEEQSALNLLLLIGTEPGTFELFGESDERYRIAEGADSVPTRLAERLRRPVEFDTQLQAIRQSADGTYVLTVTQASTLRDILADEVVLALPFTMLRQVDMQVELPAVKRLAIDTLGYGTNAKVIAGFATRVWQAAGSNGSTLSDLPYQSSQEASSGQEGAHGLLTNFVGGERGVAVGRGTSEAQAADFVTQLEPLFPGAVAAYTGQAVRAHWPTAPLVLGSYASYRPGQYTTIAGAERESVGGLHFAGEHTSLRFPGFMNGASESGERVAANILRFHRI